MKCQFSSFRLNFKVYVKYEVFDKKLRAMHEQNMAYTQGGEKAGTRNCHESRF
jgi:hypothetical protein